MVQKSAEKISENLRDLREIFISLKVSFPV